MEEDSELKGGLVTASDDWRITKIGKVLRKYKLDELPQLFNVLKGEMSFVGPRPEALEFVNLYSEEEKELVLSVKPGITDLSSIEFVQLGDDLGSREDEEEFSKEIHRVLKKKLELRIEYINNRSFLLDMKILFRTFTKLISSVL